MRGKTMNMATTIFAISVLLLHSSTIGKLYFISLFVFVFNAREAVPLRFRIVVHSSRSAVAECVGGWGLILNVLVVGKSICMPNGFSEIFPIICELFINVLIHTM